jgi:hypothetical protein
MLIMENYVVRIYRRSNDNPENITGVVEKPDKGENKAFNSKEEFNNIFWPTLHSNNSTKLKRTLEFRKYRRFIINKGTLIFDSTTDIGRIIDISMGGLAFTCPNIPVDPKELFRVGIIFGNNQYNTEKIQCRLIRRDTRSTIIDAAGKDSINSYSLKFENLTPYQTSQIRYIIQNFTLGNV